MSLPRKVIAIFDDDEDILGICTYILKVRGWQVHAFTTCNDVLEKIEGVMPSVVLMDNWIPDEGGIVATRAIKSSEKFKHLPVIYFSANIEIAALAEAAGADAYIAKPFDLDLFERQLSAFSKA